MIKSSQDFQGVLSLRLVLLLQWVPVTEANAVCNSIPSFSQ